jgi:FkbM family methyltransferase
LCDLCIQSGVDPKQIDLSLVEADPRCIKYLESHVEQLRALGVAVKIFHGLAGKISGQESIKLGKETFGTTVHEGTPSKQSSTTLNYVDLNSIHPGMRFNLIKCDIEGSEYDLINYYPNLIKAADYFLVEFHTTLGSLNDAESALVNSNLSLQATLCEEQTFVTKYYRKEAQVGVPA